MDDAGVVVTPSPEQLRWLERAVELGRRGWGQVHPNPMVGCVLVKDGLVLSEGWHEEDGGTHAEVNALVGAGSASAGATAYVSLEPCDHYGRTPPCSEGLIAAGVKTVVYGARDPGSQSGRGHSRLVSHGVEVVGPCFDSARAYEENPAFFSRAEGSGPYLALKLAVSSDGMIAAGPGETTRITGEQGAREVMRLRAGFDAILVGSQTAVVDDPLLTVRGDLQPRVPPTRVVFDSSGRLRADARMFSDEAPVVVVTSPSAPETWMELLRGRGATVRVVEGAPSGGLRMASALEALAYGGIESILCEGGARLATSLMEADAVQRFYLFSSAQPLGDSGVSAFVGEDQVESWLTAARGAAPPRGWRLVETSAFGEDRLSVWSRRGEPGA